MEEIKNLRASFTGADNPDMLVPKKNKYGHTVLSTKVDSEPSDIISIDIDVDENGLVTANPKSSPFEHPVFEEYIDNLQHKINPSNIILEEEAVPTEIENKLSNIERMLATFDDDEKEVSKNNRICSSCKSSINNTCKFCPECGTQQVSKFCSQCGNSFKPNDKFCSDCGNKR